MEDFLCGGAASVAAITCVHPIDVVKTRLQFQGELSNGVATGRKLEGLQGLYRGLVSAYALQVSVTATRFGVYGVAKRYWKSLTGRAEESFLSNFLFAGFAGACGALAGNPFYAIKTRAQTYSPCKELAVGTQHQSKGSLYSELVEIWRTEGMKGYFRGLQAFMPRVVAYGAVQLSVFDSAKVFFKKSMKLDEGFMLHVYSSVVAALCAVAAIQPFDFLAARLMNQDPTAKLYNGLFDCAYKSVKSEGITCLAKGGLANLARMGPYTVLVLIFVEQFKRLSHLLRDSEK